MAVIICVVAPESGYPPPRTLKSVLGAPQPKGNLQV